MAITKHCEACGRCIRFNGKFVGSILCEACDPDPVKRKSPDWNRKVRAELLLRDSSTCHWCKLRVKPNVATIDHLVPLSRGGTNKMKNLVLACSPCNAARGNELPHETEARLAQADTAKLKGGRSGRSPTHDRNPLSVQTDRHGGVTTSKDLRDCPRM